MREKALLSKRMKALLCFVLVFMTLFAPLQAFDTSVHAEEVTATSSNGQTVTASTYELSVVGATSIALGETEQTVVSVTYDGQSYPVTQGLTFTSQNETVAKVTPSTGIVEGVGIGSAVIGVTHVLENGQQVVGTYNLQVTASSTAQVADRLLAKNATERKLDLEMRGLVELTPFYKVEQLLNGTPTMKSLSDVMVGATNVSFLFNSKGQAYKVILNGETPMDTMRVGIRFNIANISDMTQLDHTKVDMRSAEGFQIVDKKADRTLTIAPTVTASFTSVNGETIVAQGTEELYRTTNRLYAKPVSKASLIQIMSFTRAVGNPQYRGVFEIFPSPVSGKLRLINEVSMEEYLYQVVPSEMPASFGLEALRAQAIAARTYALTDYVSNRFADKGFHIDDSTLSQVYNNSAENALTTQAVIDTSGKIMMSGNELVDARFYSTSAGYGASKHEVWADSVTNLFPGTPIPYLIARSYTYDPASGDEKRILNIDTSDEAALNAYFKNLSLTGYDSESYYFRWKVGLTKTELENTINANIISRQAADPLFVLTKQSDGTYASKAIPPEGIGSLLNMYVAKRGAGGNVTELVIEGTTGIYKILKEYNIRFTIRPNKASTKGADVILYRAKGGSTAYDTRYNVLNPTILSSAFFTFDLGKDSAGGITDVTFYGGGSGHGVGMSQYGASMLGNAGWSYDRILNSYYANMQIVKLNGYSIDLQGITMTGLTNVKVGGTSKPVITASYSDGTSRTLTTGVTFAVANPAVASNAADGTITGLAGGRTELTATYMGKSVTVPFTVEGFGMTAPTSLKVNETGNATGLYYQLDGTTTVVTNQTLFSSSASTVAAVDADGTIRALSEGMTVVSATYGDVTRTANLTILAASAPPVEQPPVEQPPVEQPPVEQPPVEQPPVEQPPVEQPPVEQPPVEQPPVEQPPMEQPQVPTTKDLITKVDTKLLTEAKGATVTVKAEEGRTGAALPANAADLLSGGAVKLELPKVTVTMGNEVLAELQQKLGSKDGTIEVNAAAVSAQVQEERLAEAQLRAEGSLKLTGPMLEFSVGVQSGTDKKAVDQLVSPVKLSLSMENVSKPRRVGVYLVGKDGELEYIRTSLSKDGKSVEAEVTRTGTLAVMEYNVKFQDVEDTHWGQEAIADLAAQHVVDGVGGGKFVPEQKTTRAEFTAMLVRALGLKASKQAAFADVAAEDWYAGTVAAAVEAGLVHGMDANRFAPNELITREQMAVMLVRAAELGGVIAKAEGAPAFTDAEATSDWAQEAIQKAAGASLLHGKGEGIFAPKDQTTKAESAKAIHNMLFRN